MLFFILGIIIRIYVFSVSNSLWHDECSLALNIWESDIKDYFSPLKYWQCSPPLFMIITKLITNILGINEYSLHLFPLICSVLSIPSFYLLSKQVLKNKVLILAANFLFSFNYNLIYYSREFKQYSTEVLVAILLLIILSRVEIKNISAKNIFIFGVISSIIPFVSFSSIFIITSYILNQLLQLKKEDIKKIFIYILPIIFFMEQYYFILLKYTHSNQIFIGNYLWQNGFLELNFEKILSIFQINLKYFFNSNFYISAVILCILVIIYSIKSDNNTIKLCTYTIFFAVIASFLKIFPIYERVALYLIPIVILLFLFCIEININKIKIKMFFVCLCCISCFYPYFSNYLFKIGNKTLYSFEEAKNSLKFIINNYNRNEVFIYNDASFPEYRFYQKYFDFYPYPRIKITISENNKNDYFKILDNLPKGKTYWFYYPFEYKRAKVITFLKEWLLDKNVELEYYENNSYACKVVL